MASTVSSTQALSHPEQNRWVQTLARVGYAAKGIVYGLIGVLALQVAFGSGGALAGGQEAVQYIDQKPFGKVLLGLVGVGLLGYALWRFIEAAKDPEHTMGRDNKGMLKRLGAVGSGIANVGLAVTALQLAFSEGGGGQSSWVTQLMDEPFGQFLVGAIGAGILVLGLTQLKSAYTAQFMKRLRTGEMSATEQNTVRKVGRLGLAARGVVFAIIGTTILQAAIRHDAGQAKGIGEALAGIADSPGGVIMLIVVAAGLVAYGAFQLVNAKYRKLAAS